MASSGSGVNGMGQYYPIAGPSQQPQQPQQQQQQQQPQANTQPYAGPSGQAGVTNSSIPPSTYPYMSYSMAQDYQLQQLQQMEQLQRQQLQQQQQQQPQQPSLMEQYGLPAGVKVSYASTAGPSSNAGPSSYPTFMSYAPPMVQTDSMGSNLEYDQSSDVAQLHWNQQQTNMFPPTEVFSRMPVPTQSHAQPPPMQGAPLPMDNFYVADVSPPRSPKAAPKKPPRPPNSWILYRSDTLEKMSRGERIPSLERELEQRYGPRKYPVQTWPAANESTSEDDSSGPKTNRPKRKGKKGGKDLSWYMWMLGFAGSADGGMPQSDVSKVLSAVWHGESAEVKKYYEELSQKKKEEHLKMYPGYKFQPQKKEDKLREKARKLEEKELRRQEKEERVHRNSALKRRQMRRSPSAELTEFTHHPYHMPGHSHGLKHYASATGQAMEGDTGFELPLDGASFQIPRGFDANAFAQNVVGEGVPSSSPSLASKTSGNGVAGPSPGEQTALAIGELPDAASQASWAATMNPAAPPPQQASTSLFTDVASGVQAASAKNGDDKYVFQPVVTTLPLAFINPPPVDAVEDDPDELENLVSSWANDNANINLNFDNAEFNASWDLHEASTQSGQVFGEGPIMHFIKNEWERLSRGDNLTGLAGPSSFQFDTNFPANFGQEGQELPPGPPLAGPHPLSPVDQSSQQRDPLPETRFSDWVLRPGPGSAAEASLPSPFNAGNLSDGSFALSVDPTVMWANVSDMAMDDVASSVGPATAVPAPGNSQPQLLQLQQQQGSMVSGQQQNQNQNQGQGQYGPA